MAGTGFQPDAFQDSAFQVEGGSSVTPGTDAFQGFQQNAFQTGGALPISSIPPSDAFQGFQQDAFQGVGGVPALVGDYARISWTQKDNWNVSLEEQENITVAWTSKSIWNVSINIAIPVTANINWTDNPTVWSLNLNQSAPQVSGTGSGGSYSYYAWSYDDELEHQRELAKHHQLVYEAAIEAVTHNYYAPRHKIDMSGMDKLMSMARDLEVKITKQDKILLKMEIDRIRYLQEMDDEETILLL